MKASFVRSGQIGLYRNALRLFSRRGYGWPHVPADYSSATSAYAYDFNFDASGVNPSRGPNDRSFGLPVRCLV